MAKYSIPDGHWDDDDEDDAAAVEPPVRLYSHVVWIDDDRDAHGYEYGLEWAFAIEDGTVTGVSCGHYLEGRTQADLMAVTWADVPEYVKLVLERELNVDDVDDHLDLPAFRRGDRDA
ncbi:hypothetical protein [Salinilacihabitans rarus]|uniref:hypothetical protein n=1 Tax=Salinilacihabitans rarus TaxID=2961596 RepID=UPI0020C8EA97|nr:hypothetical protein [Salinilacihabitans rarus]